MRSAALSEREAVRRRAAATGARFSRTCGRSTSAWNQRSSLTRLVADTHAPRLPARTLEPGARAQRLGVQLLEAGDVLVPLQQRRATSRERQTVLEEAPDLVDHAPVVRIDDVRAVVGVPGQVVLDHALVRDRIDVRAGVEAVVERADVDVVDVQEQRAVGLLGNA